MTVDGSPPVLRIALGAEAALPGSNGFQDRPTTTRQFADILDVQFVYAFLRAGTGDDNPAGQAVQAALLQRLGIPFADQPVLRSNSQLGPEPDAGTATGPVLAAAQRLAALPAPAWHDWLAAHLTAVRSGELTPDRLP